MKPLLVTAAGLLLLLALASPGRAADISDDEGPPLGTMAQIIASSETGQISTPTTGDYCHLDSDKRWQTNRAIEKIRESWFWEEADWIKSESSGRPELGTILAEVESKVPKHRKKLKKWFEGAQGLAEDDIMKAITGTTQDAVVFSGSTSIQHVEIGKSALTNPPDGQYLKLDGCLQSSSADEALYHESLVHQAMVAHSPTKPKGGPKRVLIGGGGEGANLREVLKYKSVDRVLMVDIDKEFVDMCKEHLGTYHLGKFDDPRVEVRFGDARAYMEAASEKVVGEGGGGMKGIKSMLQRLGIGKKKDNEEKEGESEKEDKEEKDRAEDETADERWDVIILDFPDFLPRDTGYLLGQLYSVEFYTAVKRRLSPGGLLIIQGGSFEIPAVRRTLRQVFRHVTTSTTIMFTYPLQTWFLASDDVDVGALSGTEVDRRLAERMGAEAASDLKWYDGTVHDRMFGLGTKIADGGYFDDDRCVIVDRTNFDDEVDDSEDDSSDSEDDYDDDDEEEEEEEEEVPSPGGGDEL